MRRQFLLLTALAAFSVGCGNDEPVGDGDVTFYKDILPLAEQHCSGCHRSGSLAIAWPESVELARQNSMAIAEAVRDRVMPPWLASERCEPLSGSRALTDQEIATFVRWNELGAPAGNPADTTPTKRMLPPGLARVDTELVTPPYTPAIDGDDWHCVVVNPQLAEPRDLIGIEIEPTLRERAHHVLVYRVEQAGFDPAPAPAACETLGSAATALIGSWVLGTPPTQFPSGTGITLRAGDKIMVESHYAARAPDGKPPPADEITVRLQFSEQPVSRAAGIIAIGMFAFTVPPYSRNFKLSVDSTASGLGLTEGATVWGLTPHLHARGRTLGVARTRGSEEACLLEVPRWDDRWQEYFFFSNPEGMRVEASDVLHLTCSWDNPTGEPVYFGPTAHDEMCLSYLYVTN